MSSQTLLLDPDIRDWVVLPLFVIMIAAGLLRIAVGQLLASPKEAIKPTAHRAEASLRHAVKIRSGASNYLPTCVWIKRKAQVRQMLQDEADWCDKQHEEAAAKENDDPMAAMMGSGNPMNMMKGNMAFMVQNMIMMQGIQHFFSGFILLKVPFYLTSGFKSMFQRGLAENMPDLDSSYVSAVSWYFLVMYGLRAFFRVVAGEPTLEQRETDMFQRQALGLQNPAAPGSNSDAEALAKALRQESDNLELLLQHKSEMDMVEKRLLGKRYPKKIRKGGGKDDLLFADDGKKKKKSKKKD